MAVSRPRLSRTSVLAAAVTVADGEGLEAVTMRRVAEALGVVPMALYKHVADKDDLVAGMVDTLVDQMRPGVPAESAEWRDRVVEALRSARRVVVEHPWAQRAIESCTTRTSAVLAHMERVTSIFLDAGFTPDLTHHVMHLLGNRLWGFSPELFPGAPASASPSGTSRGAAPVADPADYPGILAIAADARARRPHATGCDEDFEFDFALDVILTGVERLHRTRWASTPSEAASAT